MLALGATVIPIGSEFEVFCRKNQNNFNTLTILKAKRIVMSGALIILRRASAIHFNAVVRLKAQTIFVLGRGMVLISGESEIFCSTDHIKGNGVAL
jgi:hypothetical protein